MPKIEITDSKGLVQKTGSGVDVQSAGLCGVVSTDIAIANAAGDNDGTLSLPARALITEIAVVVTDAFTTRDTNADDTVDLKVGTAAGGGQIIAQPGPNTGFVGRNNTAVVGSRMSTSSGALIAAASTAFTFADGAPLYSDAARTIHPRIVVVNSALKDAETGAVRVECKYTVI